MKFLVLAACVASAAASGFYGLQAHPNGAVTPLDEPRVAAARAEHLATKFGAGPIVAAGPAIAAAPLAAAPLAAAPLAAAPVAYAAAPIHIPNLVAHPNGAVTPADEPAVAAARADHLAAVGEAYAAAAPIIAAAPAIAAPAIAAPAVAAAPLIAAAPAYAGPLHLPSLVAHPNGAVTPADEPAVLAARADHLAAHGVVGGVYAAAPAAYAAGYAAGYLPYAGLVAHPNGAVVPIDEPAVAAARADHLAAKAASGW